MATAVGVTPRSSRPHHPTQPGDRLIPAAMRLDENGNPIFSYPEPTPQKQSPEIVAPRSMLSRLNHRRRRSSKKKQQQQQSDQQQQQLCPELGSSAHRRASLNQSLQLEHHHDDHEDCYSTTSKGSSSVASSVAGSVVSLAGRMKRRLRRNRRKKLEQQLERSNGMILSPLKEISHDNGATPSPATIKPKQEESGKKKKKKLFKSLRRMSGRRSSTTSATSAASSTATSSAVLVGAAALEQQNSKDDSISALQDDSITAPHLNDISLLHDDVVDDEDGMSMDEDEEDDDDERVLSPPKVLFQPEISDTTQKVTAPAAVQVLKAGTAVVHHHVDHQGVSLPISPPPVASLRDAMDGISPVQQSKSAIQDDSFIVHEQPQQQREQPTVPEPIQPASVTPMQGGVLSAPALQSPKTRKQVTIVNPGEAIVIAAPEIMMMEESTGGPVQDHDVEDDPKEEEEPISTVEEESSFLMNSSVVTVDPVDNSIVIEHPDVTMETIVEDEIDTESGLVCVQPPNNNQASAVQLFSRRPQAANIKIYLLLLHPTSKIFELIQLYVDPTTTTIRDMLLMIPYNATEASLGAQAYTGICRPKPKDGEQQEISNLDLLVQNHENMADSAQIAAGEVLVAIPVNYTCKKIAALSQQILVNPRISRLLDNEPPATTTTKKTKKRYSQRRRRRSSSRKQSEIDGKLTAVLEEMDDPNVMSMHRAMANAMSAAAAANAAVNVGSGSSGQQQQQSNGSFFGGSVSGAEESASLDCSVTLATTTLTDTSEASRSLDRSRNSVDKSYMSWSRSLDVSIMSANSVTETGNVAAAVNASQNSSMMQATARRRKKKMSQVKQVLVGTMGAMCFVYWRDPDGYASRHARSDTLLHRPLEVTGFLQLSAFFLLFIKLQFLCRVPSIQSSTGKSKCPFVKLRASIQAAAETYSPRKRRSSACRKSA